MSADDRYNLEELARIITNPSATEEEKRLALSVAYENGKRDALRDAGVQPRKLPW